MSLVIEGPISDQERKILETGILKALEVTNIKKWSIIVRIQNRDEITATNKALLNHNYATDIITIPYQENTRYLETELFICPDVIKENASDLEVNYLKELERVGIHGILHLTGWNDKTSSEKQEMRNKESEIIRMVPRGT